MTGRAHACTHACERACVYVHGNMHRAMHARAQESMRVNARARTRAPVGRRSSLRPIGRPAARASSSRHLCSAGRSASGSTTKAACAAEVAIRRAVDGAPRGALTCSRPIGGSVNEVIQQSATESAGRTLSKSQLVGHILGRWVDASKKEQVRKRRLKRRRGITRNERRGGRSDAGCAMVVKVT